MFYPLEHVRVGSKKLHQFVGGAQAHFLLANLREFVVADGAAHVPVNLGQLSNFIPGTGGVIKKECLDPLNLLQQPTELD